MIITKRHINAFFLLVLTTFPVVIAGALYVDLWRARYEIGKRLENHSVQVFTLAKNDIQWEEYGREFVYRGKMFDIKSMVEKGDSCMITGLYDEAETSIRNNLSSLMDSHPDSAQRNAILARIYHHLVWEYHAQSFTIPTGFPSVMIRFSARHSRLPGCPYLGLIKPPPDRL